MATIILSPTLPNQPYQNSAPALAQEQYRFHSYGSQPNAFQDYSSQHSSFPFSHQDYVSQTQMGGSSSQPRMEPAMSPINAFPVEELYTLEFLNSFRENTGYWKQPNPHKYSIEQVSTSPTKKKATCNHQKRTIESDDEPRQTAWTTEEEIALTKGWLVVFENSKHGNERRKAGFWCEVLQYIESKKKQHGRRTYDMVYEKWKTVRPSLIRFCGIYNYVMRMAHESESGDAYYVQTIMIHYELETGLLFKLCHCWEILKDRLKWQEIAIPNFNTGSEGGSKRHKSSGSSSFNTESGKVIVNLNTTVGDNDEDEVQEIQRPEGMTKRELLGGKIKGQNQRDRQM
ncbi:hypothetical protein Tco_1435885 [Tanacetum coccineum]